MPTSSLARCVPRSGETWRNPCSKCAALRADGFIDFSASRLFVTTEHPIFGF